MASNDFPLFADGGGGFLIISLATSRAKQVSRLFNTSSSVRTISVFMRQGTNQFAQLSFFSDTTNFANFDLATGQLGDKSTDVTSTIIP